METNSPSPDERQIMQVKAVTTRLIPTKKYDKPHKFFKKELKNDLEKLSQYLHRQYEHIDLTPENPDYRALFEESKSASTIKWREYNDFQFLNPEIYEVFAALRETIIEACEYYGVDFKEQQYMVQGWFNINHKNVGKLDWHDHGGPWAPSFHGYYAIKAEPSSTWYKLEGKDDNIVENKNIDNVLIVSEMGHPHAMGDWDWDGPRITLAYDIVPLKLLRLSKSQEQHWFPLA
jgi:hypothetical protein